MEEDLARKLAWKILGEVEEAMSEDGVGILSPDGRYTGRQEPACFLDPEYEQLEQAITSLLRAAIASDADATGLFAATKSPAALAARRSGQ